VLFNVRNSSTNKGRTWIEGVSEQVAGGWRRLHNEELHKLKASLILLLKPSNQVG
jgi:hypothetical protein